MEVVYQDLALAPHLNPVQNLFLGREIPRKGILGPLGFMDEKAMRARAVAGFQELGGTVRSFTAPVGAMSGGQRQQIAIVRAIAWAAVASSINRPRHWAWCRPRTFWTRSNASGTKASPWC